MNLHGCGPGICVAISALPIILRERQAAVCSKYPCKKRRHDSSSPAINPRLFPPSESQDRRAASAVPAAVASWLRQAIGDDQVLAAQGIADIGIVAGAIIGALDGVVRAQERSAGVWRQRLALGAAAATVRQAGRTEDEAGLRDALLLTRPGDDVGPAGRMALVWQRLATRPADELLGEASLAAMLEGFGYASDDDLVSALADGGRRLAQLPGLTARLSGAVALAGRCDCGPAVGAFIADALLARQLGWEHALPLSGGQSFPGYHSGPRRRSGQSRGEPVTAVAGADADEEMARKLLVAQARAALRAIDLAAMLERRAQKLLAVAPKLRAKASGVVVAKLLGEDAIIASQNIAGISDRGLRRLFDRLIEFGAVRELTGRPTFRIYGL